MYIKLQETAKITYKILRPVYDLWGHDTENHYKYSAYLQVGLALAVKEEIPQVKYATRFHDAPGIDVTSGDKASKEKISLVDWILK